MSRIMPGLFVAAFCSLLNAFVCNAQQYDPQFLDLIEADSVTGIAMTESGFVLGNAQEDANSERQCPFLAKRDGSSLVRLCDKGFTKVYDVNRYGQVIGIQEQRGIPNAEENEYASAWVWSKGRGKRQIAKLRSNHTFVIPFAINDKGVVVGISGFVERETEYPGEADEYTFVRQRSEAFIWDAKRGSRALFLERSLENSQDSIAFDINNKGTIVSVTLDATDEYGYFERTHENSFLLRKLGAQRKKLTEMYYSDYSDPISRALSLTDQNRIITQGYFYDYRTAQLTPIAPHYTSDRGDVFAHNATSSSNGRYTVGTSTTGFLQTPSRGDLELQCLVAMNTTVRGSTLKYGAFTELSGIAVLNNGDVLAHGDIAGDGKHIRLVLLKKRSAEKFGRFYDFCPQLEEVDMYYSLDHVECSRQPRYNKDYGQYEYEEGTKCTFSTTLSSDHDNASYAGVPLSIQFISTNSNYDNVCTDSLPASVSSGNENGDWVTTITGQFNVSSRVSVDLILDDPRFRRASLFIRRGDKGELCHNQEAMP